MNRVIFLACIGACVGQLPANTYLSFVGAPYLSGDPRLQGVHYFDPARSEDPDAPKGPPSYSIQNSSNPTIEDINAAVGSVGTDENAQLNAQAAYQESVTPQPRLMGAARTRIPIPLYAPHVSDPTSVPYGNSPYFRNGGNPFLGMTPESDSLPRLNPRYSGPSLFSHSAQAAAELGFSSRHQYQPAAYPSNMNPSPTAATYSRSLEGYDSSDETQANRPSNQNGDLYQATQGSLDPSSYQFSYNVNAVEGGRSVQFGHEERRAADEAAGSYSVLLPDGQRQTVEYTADRDGYRPRVTYDGHAGTDVHGNAGSDLYANPGTDFYGNDESSVISARSSLNGQANPMQSRYIPQDPRTRFQPHLLT